MYFIFFIFIVTHAFFNGGLLMMLAETIIYVCRKIFYV